MFGRQVVPGLSDLLQDGLPLDRVIQPTLVPSLSILPAGRPVRNPSELLGSPEMRRLIEEALERYDRIILDTPAALGLPDAKAVSDLCDGIVMVVLANVTARSDVEAVVEILDRHRILGLLINGVEADQGRYGYAS